MTPDWAMIETFHDGCGGWWVTVTDVERGGTCRVTSEHWRLANPDRPQSTTAATKHLVEHLARKRPPFSIPWVKA